MSRLLAVPLALPRTLESGLARVTRVRLVVIAVAAAVLVGAAALVLRTWWPGDGRSEDLPAQQGDLRAARARAIADARARNANWGSRAEKPMPPRVRTANVTNAGALFATHSWYVAPPPPPAPPPAPTVSSAPPVPTAPPLPFQYIGSFKAEGEAQVFFLTNGDRVYDAKIGDTLENNYRVDGFNGSQLVLTYKPLNIQQQLSAGGSQ